MSMSLCEGTPVTGPMSLPGRYPSPRWGTPGVTLARDGVPPPSQACWAVCLLRSCRRTFLFYLFIYRPNGKLQLIFRRAASQSGATYLVTMVSVCMYVGVLDKARHNSGKNFLVLSYSGSTWAEKRCRQLKYGSHGYVSLLTPAMIWSPFLMLPLGYQMCFWFKQTLVLQIVDCHPSCVKCIRISHQTTSEHACS